MTDPVLRPATTADADALFALINSQIAEGHLLPRELGDLRRHASRFVVCEVAGAIKACGELARLSPAVAEIRSLVVAPDFRRVGIAARIVGELTRRARLAGFDVLSAFTHDPRFFVRQDFSIVPHVRLPEKIASTCVSCPLFRRCRQHAMIFPLYAIPLYRPTVAAGRDVAVA